MQLEVISLEGRIQALLRIFSAALQQTVFNAAWMVDEIMLTRGRQLSGQGVGALSDTVDQR